MSARAVQLDTAHGRERAGASPRYAADLARDWSEVSRDWAGAATPFQGVTWLGSWYDELSAREGVAPLIATVREVGSGEVAFRLPLVLRDAGGWRSIEFADLDLTDYNAPLLGPAAPRDRRGASRAMRAVRRVLPPADLLRLAKMPASIGGRPNPLAQLRNAVPSALNGNVVETGDDFDVWRRSLGRAYRKELERSWRVFTRAPDATFAQVTDPAEARDVMATLERQQGERMRSVGNAYELDDPEFSRFYGTLVTRGVADGSVVVTALRAQGELVAGLVGLRERDGYIMVRISQAGARWANCSPGRLIIERTIAHLHADGCRSFDFSIGNYDYKRRFDTAALPLVDVVEALGWRGLRLAARARLVGRLRAYPQLDARLRALRARLSR